MEDIDLSFEAVDMVTNSWDDIKSSIPNVAEVAGEMLFRKIFDLAPGAWKLYPFGTNYDSPCDEMFQEPSFKAHSKNVVSMLDLAVHFLGPDLMTLQENLIQLGARHVTYGVLPEHYPIVGEALLHTLKTALGEEKYTTELHEAWAGVYGFITDSMVKGANESLTLLTFKVYNDEGKRGNLMSLDAYIAKMLPYQQDIFYVTVPFLHNKNKNRLQKDKQQNSTQDTPSKEERITKKRLQKLKQHRIRVLCIQKRMESTTTKSLSKYLGRKLVNVETAELIDLRFLGPNRDGTTGSAPGRTNSADNSNGGGGGSSSNWLLSHYERSETSTLEDHSITSISMHSCEMGSSMNGSSRGREELSTHEATNFCAWFQQLLGPKKVHSCTPTCKLESIPARLLLDKTKEIKHMKQQQQSSIRRNSHGFRSTLLSSAFSSSTKSSTTVVIKKIVEVNPYHPVIVGIYEMMESQPTLAELLAEQVYDNCLVAGGFMDDCRTMIPRLNGLMLAVINGNNNNHHHRSSLEH